VSNPAPWEKIMLLLVWLQPMWWWWWLVGATGVSPAPLVYAAFFAAVLYRARPVALEATLVRGQ